MSGKHEEYLFLATEHYIYLLFLFLTVDESLLPLLGTLSLMESHFSTRET